MKRIFYNVLFILNTCWWCTVLVGTGMVPGTRVENSPIDNYLPTKKYIECRRGGVSIGNGTEQNIGELNKCSTLLLLKRQQHKFDYSHIVEFTV